MKIQTLTGLDLTSFVGNITLSTNLDTLGASLDFDLARNYDDLNYSIIETVKVGDIILFTVEKRVFTGIIVGIDTNRFSKSVKCLDFYFYLNKNKVIKQFNKINASSAITELLKSIGAKVGEVDKISTLITQIYRNRTIIEIIKDIVEQVNNELGKKYVLEVEDDVFHLRLYKKIKIELDYNSIGVPTLSESITEMKNKVLVVSNKQENMAIIAKAEDESKIKKYGMLQEIIEVGPDKDNVAKVRNIANIKLKELSREERRISVDVLGNMELKAGRIVDLNIPSFQINREFLIKSCVHKFHKGNQVTSLELEEFNEVSSKIN